MRPLISTSVFGIAILAGSSAYAADMEVKAAPPAPAAYGPYNWTGFYVGGEVGGGWATSTTTIVTAPAKTSNPAGTVQPSHDFAGAIGGFYGGYNYQFNQFVIGIDGDYTWSGMTASGADVGVAAPHDVGHYSDQIDWVATATGRVGWAIDKLLLFAKGGWAWAGFEANTSGENAAGTINTSNESSQETRDGWTAGGGLEYAVAQNIIFKLEGDYVKFNTANYNNTEQFFTAPNVGLTEHFARSSTSDLTMFKGGLAFKF